MGSDPNCCIEILTRHAIRWFKCKLEPPKRVKRRVFLKDDEYKNIPINMKLKKKWRTTLTMFLRGKAGQNDVRATENAINWCKYTKHQYQSIIVLLQNREVVPQQTPDNTSGETQPSFSQHSV